MSDLHEKYYQLLDEKERQEQLDKILGVWNTFLSINDSELNNQDVFINQRMLAECVERVSKRKYYFEIFHRLTHVSEFKEAALYIFWITKLKPFTITKETSPLCASVNELFCVHLLISTFEKIGKDTQAERFHYPSKAMVSDFVYGLKYQDFTKESIIVYVEALAEACGLSVFDSEPLR